MLDRSDQAVVVGGGIVVDERRTGAAPLILVALRRIQRSQIETRSLIGDRGARCSGCSRLDCGGACGHDTRTPGATCTPDSGNVDGSGPSQRSSHRHMKGMAPDVLNLELPASSKLTLNTCRPYLGVGRMELGRRDNILRLRKELRGSRSWNLGLRKWIGCHLANRPWAGEADGPRGRGLSLVDGGSEGRVILVALGGEEIHLVITQREAGAQNGLAIADGIERQSQVRRELPRRVLCELPGYTGVTVVQRSRRSIRVDRAALVRQKISQIEDNSTVEDIHGQERRGPAEAAGHR